MLKPRLYFGIMILALATAACEPSTKSGGFDADGEPKKLYTTDRSNTSNEGSLGGSDGGGGGDGGWGGSDGGGGWG